MTYLSVNHQQNKKMPSNVFNIIAEKSNDFPSFAKPPPSKANPEQTASGYVPIISFKSLSFKREQLCRHKTIIPKALKL